MSTPQSKFKREIMKGRRSTNIEDRRPVFTGRSPRDSAGFGGSPTPDINKPVPHHDYFSSRGGGDALTDRYRAEMAFMPPYVPSRRKRLPRTK